MAALIERITDLEKFRDGNGQRGAAAKIIDLEKCTNTHATQIKDLIEWQNKVVHPFMVKANIVIWALILIGTPLLGSIIALIWSILTHEVTIVR